MGRDFPEIIWACKWFSVCLALILIQKLTTNVFLAWLGANCWTIFNPRVKSFYAAVLIFFLLWAYIKASIPNTQSVYRMAGGEKPWVEGVEVYVDLILRAVMAFGNSISI